jgi:Protein of unknown function (DUF4256)
MNGQNYTDLIQTLETRFAANKHRHPGLSWDEARARLAANPAKCAALAEMERSGGEPDVVVLNYALCFADCSPESPAGRRSLCFDRKALDARKENKPGGAALELAAAWGAELLTEAQYRALQELGEFDRKTSSWIATPAPIRALGGALFCDRRYDTVFVYHNGAESYYAARGFRVRLLV